MRVAGLGGVAQVVLRPRGLPCKRGFDTADFRNRADLEDLVRFHAHARAGGTGAPPPPAEGILAALTAWRGAKSALQALVVRGSRRNTPSSGTSGAGELKQSARRRRCAGFPLRVSPCESLRLSLGLAASGGALTALYAPWAGQGLRVFSRRGSEAQREEDSTRGSHLPTCTSERQTPVAARKAACGPALSTRLAERRGNGSESVGCSGRCTCFHLPA